MAASTVKDGSRIRLRYKKRKNAPNEDNASYSKKQRRFDSVNNTGSLSLNGLGSDSHNSTSLSSEIESRQTNDLLLACRVQNEENDFTRFALSNNVDNVLPPLVWESLEKEDFDSLLDCFGEDFHQEDCLSCSGKHAVRLKNLKRSQILSKGKIAADRCGDSENAGRLPEVEDAAQRSSIVETVDNTDDSNNNDNKNNYNLNRDDTEIHGNVNHSLSSPTNLPVPVIPNKFYAALDCEMVGVGVKGKHNALARCSIVDYDGKVIYDRYIKPKEPITDYRTKWSGINSYHMLRADPEDVALRDIYRCMENRIIIGHAVFNDFKVLKRHPPFHMVRDTAQCKLLVELAKLEGQGNSLKKLAFNLLNKTIQTCRKGHDSVEDAITTLELFKIVRTKWEPELYSKWVKKGVDFQRCYKAMEESETKRHEDVDYLSDRYWPSHLLT